MSLSMDKLKVCSKCIYDSRIPEISFDNDGVCNYCHQVKRLKEEYSTGKAEGVDALASIFDDIKQAGVGKPYDCIIGVSGGTDSSYMLHMAKEQGLRPLAVHYDNTWNTSVATQNISKMLNALGIDLYTHVVSNKEIDDIFLAFFKAGVAEIEASTDLALAEVMYRAARKYNVKYVLEGHSFVTEGITPLGNNYFDGRYIRSIHRQFGHLKMKTYPLMTLTQFLKWTTVCQIKKIRPFWYMDYNKEKARDLLEQKYSWQYYGGHHLENRMTAFFHKVYLPCKFGQDLRNNTLSARVREGGLSRDDALRQYNSELENTEELVDYFCKRMDLSKVKYNEIMSSPPKMWKVYPTYKKHFELMRPLFYFLSQRNLVPMSFYLKYCF